MCPLEMTRRTELPLSASLPAEGDWLTTVPAACVLASSDTLPTFRPLPSIIVRARSEGTPFTSGTLIFLTFYPLLTVMSTDCPLLIRVPLRGSCEMTVPLSSSENVS